MTAKGVARDSSLIPHPSSFSAWPHRLALATAICTIPLLFIGGLVTSKGAGLAVPDWPTTFGYNPFLYPWSKMVGNIFYEHSHRLVASGVGFLTILLAVALWLREPRRWLGWLGAAALALVIVQGVIGGLRVVLLEQTLAIVHACLAQAFFALTVSLALVTSRGWRERPEKLEVDDAARLRRLGAATVGLIYAQVFFGAVLRHSGAMLDLHLLFAFFASVHVILIGLAVFRRHRDRPALLRSALLLNALLLFQLGLGLGAYLGKFGMTLPATLTVFLRTGHVVGGALLLAVSLVVTLRFFGLLAERGPAARGIAAPVALGSGPGRVSA